MYKIFNYNAYLRDYLFKIYKFILENYSSIEANKKFKYFILKLKETNYYLYKIIINLLFTDEYMLLKYRNLYNKLDESEEYILNLYNNIKDVDELLFILEDDDTLLDTFLISSINFRALNKLNQSYRMLDDSDYSRFLPTSYLEKMSIFFNVTLKQLDSEYEKLYIEGNELDAIDYFIDEIIIRSYGNVSNFKEILIDILNYYKNYKGITKVNYFIDIDEEILSLIENKSIDEIVDIFIHDYELLTYLIKEYLYYKFQKDRITKKNYTKKEASLQ